MIMINSSPVNEKIDFVEVSSDILLEYVPQDWVSNNPKILFLYHARIDTAWFKDLRKMLKEDMCDLPDLRFVWLLKNEQLNQALGDTLIDRAMQTLASLEADNRVSHSVITTSHENSICTQCGFTAILDLHERKWNYVNMQIEFYSVCEWISGESNMQF